MKRNANAHWEGNGKEGKGKLTTQSTVLSDTPYGFKSRFEDGPGTNPEELIAAAHAGCFTMKLAFNLQAINFSPSSLDTRCTITFKDGAIVNSHLEVNAIIEGLGQEAFLEQVADAEQNCPISKLLNTEITSEATLKT